MFFRPLCLHHQCAGLDATTTASGGACGEPMMTARVSNSAGANPSPSPSPLPLPPLSFARVYGLLRKRLQSEDSPTFSSSQAPDDRMRAVIEPLPRFKSPGLHLELLRDPSWKTRLHFYLSMSTHFAHVPFQMFLDFNATYILI